MNPDRDLYGFRGENQSGRMGIKTGFLPTIQRQISQGPADICLRRLRALARANGGESASWEGVVVENRVEGVVPGFVKGAYELPTVGDWRMSPDVLKLFGLTEQEMQQPLDTMLSEGISRMWRVREAMRVPYEHVGDAIPEELKEVEAARGQRYQETMLRANGLDRPLWQALSGLDPASEAELSPALREQAIQKLLSAVVRLLKFEMKEAEKNRDAWRSYMWDPLPKLCYFLGISRAKLTRYSKEVMGLSAHELVDGIRVQSLRARMKESLRAMVGFAMPNLEAASNEEKAYQIWKELKVRRKSPKWDRQSWAIGLGFPNYARMYRACLVLFGKTPAQMEFEVIEELVGEMVEEQKSKVEGPAVVASGVGSPGDQVNQVQFFEGRDRVMGGEQVGEAV